MAERVFPGLFLFSLSILVGIYYYTHAEGNYGCVERIRGGIWMDRRRIHAHSKNFFPPPSLEEYHDRRMFAVSRAYILRIVRKNSKSQKRQSS
jgi:hypothetical protein